MSVPYLLLDVFTDQPYAGNPLAVIPFPETRLTTGQMQAIAAEFNLSETVFIYPPGDPNHEAELRIFTPAQELPFAGHPTIGAAVALGLSQRGQGRTKEAFILEEQVGPVPVTVQLEDHQRGRAALSSARLPERGPQPHDRQELAEVLSLHPEDLVWDDRWQPEAYSCGVPYLFVPLPSRNIVDRARIHTAAWDRLLKDAWAPSVFVFSRDPLQKKHTVYGRMFGPEKGIVEDPATGSAAAAFAGYLFQREERAKGPWTWWVEQGVAMGRPSLLQVTAEGDDGRLQRVQVSGQAVLVGEGRLLNLPSAL